MTLPNVLTVGRLILAIPFFILITREPGGWVWDVAFAFFVAEGVSDVLDGFLARRCGTTSKFGRVIDPLSDKVLICGAFILLVDSAGGLGLRAWMVAVIVIRELVVNSLRAFSEGGGRNYGANVFGKAKMACESVTIGAILLALGHPAFEFAAQVSRVMVWITVAVVILSGIVSILRATRPNAPEASAPSETEGGDGDPAA